MDDGAVRVLTWNVRGARGFGVAGLADELAALSDHLRPVADVVPPTGQGPDRDG